jgi:predicted ATPase
LSSRTRPASLRLVDELYEAHVKLVVRAAATPLELFVTDSKSSADDHGDLIGDAT